MELDKNTADYLSRQRWCNFKEEIRLNQINSIEYVSLPFDNDDKMLTIGKVKIDSQNQEQERFFMMPLAPAKQDETDIITINGKAYVDALQRPDYWEKMNTFLKENNNCLIFPNGLILQSKNLISAEILQPYESSVSRPLNVQQSNTTLVVGDNKLAFKLERMLQFSKKTNPEFEMNEKLMREKCTVMPQTYGYLILKDQQNQTAASSGIIQEFIENQGDLWNYSLAYLKNRLATGYLQQRDLIPEDNPHFIDLMKKLGEKTSEMSDCLSRPDNNPAFTPEKVDSRFIYHYQKHLEFLLVKTRNTIKNNLDNLPKDTKNKAAQLLHNWKQLTGEFVERQLGNVKKSNENLVRVHGDFHLGQVIVTKDNDLRFIDFAGEADSPIDERAQKHISVRDLAGMYRSIKGYLGNAAVEEFVADAPDKSSATSRRAYAEKAVKPLINESARLVLNGHSLKEPWLSLEILRKNLYEVNYEVNNRPQMAYIAVNGLSDILQPQKNNQQQNQKIR